MKKKPFPWHESPLAQPTIWAGAMEVLTYTRAFHYALGGRFEVSFSSPKAPGKLLVSLKYTASDPELGFEEPYALEVKIDRPALEMDDEAALDYLVDALLCPAIDEKAIRRDWASWKAHAAREHRQIEAHNRELDAGLRGGY